MTGNGNWKSYTSSKKYDAGLYFITYQAQNTDNTGVCVGITYANFVEGKTNRTAIYTGYVQLNTPSTFNFWIYAPDQATIDCKMYILCIR